MSIPVWRFGMVKQNWLVELFHVKIWFVFRYGEKKWLAELFCLNPVRILVRKTQTN